MNSKLKNALGGKFATGDRFYNPSQKISVPGPGNREYEYNVFMGIFRS